MSLKERIEALEPDEIPSLEAGQREWVAGYFHCTEDAAQLAAEADALMAEMVKVLAGLDPDQLTDDQAINLTGVLDRYNQYKDQTND